MNQPISAVALEKIYPIGDEYPFGSLDVGKGAREDYSYRIYRTLIRREKWIVPDTLLVISARTLSELEDDTGIVELVDDYSGFGYHYYCSSLGLYIYRIPVYGASPRQVAETLHMCRAYIR